MSSDFIYIEINDREVSSQLSRLEKKCTDKHPLMKKIAGVLKDEVEENFAQEGRPKKWKKSRRAEEKGGKTLQKAGLLAASISEDSGSDFALVGTNKVYAAVHNFGGLAGRASKAGVMPHMPARPFMVLSDAGLERIRELAGNYLADES